jgi:hypothetical protein
MDLYDYGLAIRKPRFFKQHYVVAFWLQNHKNMAK